MRVIAEDIEGCKYDTLTCGLPDTYSHPRGSAGQTTEAQSAIVTHTRGGRVPRQRSKPLELDFPCRLQPIPRKIIIEELSV